LYSRPGHSTAANTNSLVRVRRCLSALTQLTAAAGSATMTDMAHALLAWYFPINKCASQVRSPADGGWVLKRAHLSSRDLRPSMLYIALLQDVAPNVPPLLIGRRSPSATAASLQLPQPVCNCRSPSATAAASLQLPQPICDYRSQSAAAAAYRSVPLAATSARLA